VGERRDEVKLGTCMKHNISTHDKYENQRLS